MEHLERTERAVIAILFWPLTLGMIAVVAIAAITHKDAVLPSAGNPVSWVLFLVWLAIVRRMVRSGMKPW